MEAGQRTTRYRAAFLSHTAIVLRYMIVGPEALNLNDLIDTYAKRKRHYRWIVAAYLKGKYQLRNERQCYEYR